MRVFVLGTGRCGTVTFSKACAHVTNYSCAHESRSSHCADMRFDYPDNHIEVDPRLPWFLGELGRRFPGAFYVHLIRDPELVASSIARRWGGRASFARAFGESMLWRGDNHADKLTIARFQIDTMTANIQVFLAAMALSGLSRHSMTIDIDTAADQFPKFWERIGAQGNLQRAVREFATRYNASGPKAVAR